MRTHHVAALAWLAALGAVPATAVWAQSTAATKPAKPVTPAPAPAQPAAKAPAAPRAAKPAAAPAVAALMKQAAKASADRRLDEALALYEKAARLQPTLAEAPLVFRRHQLRHGSVRAGTECLPARDRPQTRERRGVDLSGAVRVPVEELRGGVDRPRQRTPLRVRQQPRHRRRGALSPGRAAQPRRGVRAGHQAAQRVRARGQRQPPRHRGHRALRHCGCRCCRARCLVRGGSR